MKSNHTHRSCFGLTIVLGLFLLTAFAKSARAQTNTFPIPTGNVGIGTSSPSQKLDVRGNAQILTANPNLIIQDNGTGYAAIALLSQNATGGVLDVGVEGTNANSPSGANVSGTTANEGFISTRTSQKLHLGTNAISRLTIDGSGRVGIGITSPAFTLDVNGTIHGSNIIATYQDVAEWVPSSERLSAGTVVVLDSTKSNHVTSSTTSYDTRVAGVVSAQPGIALGEESDGKVLVATTGRVLVIVDATKNPIHVGDLLVTSEVSGMAMKSEPVSLGGVQIHRPGTLIGKALEPLEKGSGKILVLLSLQ